MTHVSCFPGNRPEEADESAPGVYARPAVRARGSKRSHTGGKCVSCNLSWTPHSNLEKDNSLNHSCVSPMMGCLEYPLLTKSKNLRLRQ